MMAPRICAWAPCSKAFTPKERGYNAKFCKENCKLRSKYKRKPPPSKAGDTRYYHEVVKKDPVRLALHRARAVAHRKRVYEWLAGYKTSRGCADCGRVLHPSALQLDHEGTKTTEIGLLRHSMARLQEEIVKGQCAVRCANCHSIKTWERRHNETVPNELRGYSAAEDRV